MSRFERQRPDRTVDAMGRRRSGPFRSLAQGIVGALVVGMTVAVSLSAATPAQATPGSPGIPGEPTVVFHEDFENAPAANLGIKDYVSASGASYTATDFWSDRAECNGFVTSLSTPTNATDCTVADFGSAARRTSFQNTVRQMVSAIATLNGEDPRTNSGLAELANSRAPSGEVVFQTVNRIPLASANRFITFSVNAAATTCGRAQANLEFFAVAESGAEVPLNTTPLNPCTQGSVIGATTSINTGPIYGATLYSQRSILLEGSSLGIVLRNATNSIDGNGNDYAIDDIRILDVTPQVDKSFSPARVPVGGVSTLTLTVTNTSELAEKNGWAFTDTLSSGLVVADPASIGGTCEATVDAVAGGSTVQISDGVLEAGQTSCTITVDVTSESPRGAEPSPVVYENCAANLSNQIGIDDPACATVEFFSEPALDITKTTNATAETRVGDTVNYTVTATNTGSGDYTAENPAVVFDDLSGVLDDATYNGDATASVGSAPSYADPLLSWTGPLAVGESVSLTYSTTVTAGGDGTARNIAWVPNDPENPATPSCETPNDGTDPVTGEPCAIAQFELPKLTIAKTADRTELPGVGESVEYTIEVANVGPGDYTTENPATFVDDLGDVLDDATFDGVATASAGTASFAAPELSWEGVLAAGESATITYSATYTGEGDQSLVNVVCAPISDTAAGAESCARVTVPGARLTQWKSVESSDSPAVAGSVLTYTLHFGNDGSAAATVDAVDLLGHVLDDADVTAEPVASTGLTAVRDGETIAISGIVAPGAEATVVYEVTLKADGERGDDIAANYLRTNDPQNPPTTPTAPVCVPQDPELPTCTVTPIAAVTYAKSVRASAEPIATGTTLTYTITITSTGTATTPVSRDDVLDDVLDDATLAEAPTSDVDTVTVSDIVDGRFHMAGELAGGTTATVTYQVTVNDASARGNNTANNFLVPTGEAPAAECPDGSVDCTVTPLPAISVTKSADPASGSEVRAGDEVTYTLTFVNTGRATGGADYTDDLSGVLDDADLTTGPVASDVSLSAVPTASTMRVTGAIDADTTVTVTYTVTVKPDVTQGDHTLRNVIAITGEDAVCDAAAQTCTEHPITRTPVSPGTSSPSDGDLAITGGTVSPWMLALLALLPIGIGLIALARIRQRTAKE